MILDFNSNVDDEAEDYMHGKDMTPAEADLFTKHAWEATPDTLQQVREMTARYQRGELAIILPILIPELPFDLADKLEDFLSSIDEQRPDVVHETYLLTRDLAQELGWPMPVEAPPRILNIEDDLIQVERDWPAMSSMSIH